jgi:hypothetical protein
VTVSLLRHFRDFRGGTHSSGVAPAPAHDCLSSLRLRGCESRPDCACIVAHYWHWKLAVVVVAVVAVGADSTYVAERRHHWTSKTFADDS